MSVGSTPGNAGRALVACCALLVAPLFGLVAGGSMPNPPGNGPGDGQLLVGIAVPVGLALLASRVARVRAPEAILWAVTAVAATGVLALLVARYVATHFA